MSKSIRIVVAAHKKYHMLSDDIYVPLQVGATYKPDLDLGYRKDNIGDHLSAKDKKTFRMESGV